MNVEWEQMMAVDFICPCTTHELRYILDRNDKIVEWYNGQGSPPELIFHFHGSRDIMLHPGQPVALYGKIAAKPKNFYYIVYEGKSYMSIDMAQCSKAHLEDLRTGRMRAPEEITRYWGQATYEEMQKHSTVYLATKPLTEEEFDEELRARLALSKETDVSPLPESGSGTNP